MPFLTGSTASLPHLALGLISTQMRATGDRLEEKFIIPVARELAAGLRAIHDAGIIHRDIKGMHPSMALGSY